MVIENDLTTSLAMIELNIESRLDSIMTNRGNESHTGFRRNYVDMVFACWEYASVQYRQKEEYALEYEYWDNVKKFQFSPPEPELSLLVEQFADFRQIECLLLNLFEVPCEQLTATLQQIRLKIDYCRQVYPDLESEFVVYEILLIHFGNLSLAFSDSSFFSIPQFEDLKSRADKSSSLAAKIAFAFYALDFFKIVKSQEDDEQFNSLIQSLSEDYVGILKYLNGDDHRISFANNVLNNIWMCRWRHLLLRDDIVSDESEVDHDASDSSSYASDPPSDSEWA